MIPEDIVKEIISYLTIFHYRQVCKGWSKIWNYSQLIEVMIKKDDPRFLEEIVNKGFPIKNRFLYGGTNWRMKLKELNLVQIGEIEGIIHDINLGGGNVIRKYSVDMRKRQRICELLLCLSRAIVTNIRNSHFPKDKVIVTNTVSFGFLCDIFSPEGLENDFQSREISILKMQNVNKCTKFIDGNVRKGKVLGTICEKDCYGFGYCKEHMKGELEELYGFGVFFRIPSYKNVRCLVEFDKNISCSMSVFSPSSEHYMCFINSNYHDFLSGVSGK